MAWTDACVAQNTFGNDELEFLAEAVGPEYEHRRAAAVIGLIATGNIRVFANLKDHKGKPENISILPHSSLNESDRYARPRQTFSIHGARVECPACSACRGRNLADRHRLDTR